MYVRELRAGEEPILFELFLSTIRGINIRDYTQSQVEAWAPEDLDPRVWAEKMQSIHPFVVEIEGKIVGYSDLQPDGLIDHLFVHHEWQRRGVGRALMSEIERRAFDGGVDQLETHASITARPFFEAFGFFVVREQELEIRGERLKNYVMRRNLPGDHQPHHPMQIRAEESRDWDAVEAVNEGAFGAPAEARLVAALREQVPSAISLVAESAGEIVGHIIFSPVLLPGHPEVRIMGLGPMAVAPDHQRRGIGTALVRAGLERCRELGFDAVVVLGHPEYYPRFGFAPAARFGIGSEYDAPEEAFMLIELEPGSLHGASGKVQYHPAFNSV